MTENTNIDVFLIANLRVVPARNLLIANDLEFRLEPRVMDVLCVLAESPGEVVARDTLIDRLWPSEFGADESLTRAVSLIRKALAEAGQSTKSIETIKKRGYRLTLPVSNLESDRVPRNRLERPPKAVPQAAGNQSSHDPLVPASADISQAAHATDSSIRRNGLILTAILALAVLTLYWIEFPGRSDQASTGLLLDAADSNQENSVAVLPFIALSDDLSDRYFGVGIAEEILNALSRFPDLRVIARTSAFSFDSVQLDVASIGQQLDVKHLLTGSVRRDGEQIRLTAQLIKADDGTSLWSQRYDLDASDIFAVEDEIVRDVTQTLQVRLGVGAAAGRNDGRKVNPLAYEQYLQGLQLLGDRMRRDGNREAALAAFQRAVAFEPEFADAWAGIGTIGVVSVGSPLSRDRESFRAMTRNALRTAIELDPDNAKAHASLTLFYITQDIDLERARYHMSRAQVAAPNAAATSYAEGLFRRATADPEAALAAFDRTMVLDPLNAVIARVRAELLIEIGRFEEGMAFFEECFQNQCLGEGFIAYASAAAVLSGDEQTMATWRPRINAFEARIESIPDHQKPIVARIMPTFSSVRYQRDDAQARIAATRRLFEERLITDTLGIWGPTFAEFLEQDTVLDILHQAYERGDLFSAAYPFSSLYGVNPYPDWLLSHPRYHELWQRPGMPALARAWREAGRTSGLPTP